MMLHVNVTPEAPFMTNQASAALLTTPTSPYLGHSSDLSFVHTVHSCRHSLLIQSPGWAKSSVPSTPSFPALRLPAFRLAKAVAVGILPDCAPGAGPNGFASGLGTDPTPLVGLGPAGPPVDVDRTHTWNALVRTTRRLFGRKARASAICEDTLEGRTVGRIVGSSGASSWLSSGGREVILLATAARELALIYRKVLSPEVWAEVEIWANTCVLFCATSTRSTVVTGADEGLRGVEVDFSLLEMG